jgi:hypothetical protein
MTHLQDVEKQEATLREAADNLRANSHKSSCEYCMPVTRPARDLLFPRLMSGDVDLRETLTRTLQFQPSGYSSIQGFLSLIPDCAQTERGPWSCCRFLIERLGDEFIPQFLGANMTLLGSGA